MRSFDFKSNIDILAHQVFALILVMIWLFKSTYKIFGVSILMVGIAYAQVDVPADICRDQAVGIWLDYQKETPTLYDCYFYKKGARNRPSFRWLSPRPLKLEQYLSTGFHSTSEILNRFPSSQMRYKEMPNLLSSRAVVFSTKGSGLAQTLDQAILNVLATGYGKLFCYDDVGTRVSFLKAFGLSPKAQEKAGKYCGYKDDLISDSIFSVINGDDKTDASYRARAREFILIVSDQFKFEFSGWTNSYGVTYLMFHPAHLNDANFYKLLIHETSVLADGIVGDLGTGRRDHLDKFTYVKDIVSFKSFAQAVSNPYIAYALTALRARTMESWVLWDLGFEQKRITSLPQDCTEDLVRLIPSLLPFKDIFEIRSENAEKSLALDLLTVTSASNLCAKMYLPQVSSSFLGGTSGSGPRPRVGSGWGNNGFTPQSEEALSLNSRELIQALKTYRLEGATLNGDAGEAIETLIRKISLRNFKNTNEVTP